MSEVFCIQLAGQGEMGDGVGFLLRHHGNKCAGFAYIIVAAVVTLVLLLATRPLVKKFLQNKETHTNADRVVGQTAVVTEDIDNLAAHGRVEVLGNDWAARSTENVRIQKGTKVQVVRIEGVKLIVTPVVS